MYALKAPFRFIFIVLMIALNTPRAIYFFASRKSRNSADSKKAAQRLMKLLSRLGPAYVKMGQFLATRPELVGAGFAEVLLQLQDNLPPYPTSKAKIILRKELPKQAHIIIKNLSEPIAAASIAQVHKSSIIDNNNKINVAVKVLRPNIEKKFLLDLYIFRVIAKLIETFFTSTRRLKPVQIVDTLTKSVRLEMDLRFEAAAIQEMHERITKKGEIKGKFRVPNIFWPYVTKSVIVTEWIEGTNFTDMKTIHNSGHNCKELAVRLVQGFLENVVEHGLFHADMHQGNIFLDRQGQLTLIDFGIVGRLSKIWRRFYAEIIYSFIAADYMRGARVHFEAGYVSYGQDPYFFAQALRSIAAPIYGLPSKEISIARLLMQLLEITDLFDMKTQEKLLLLQKNMVIVEGICRQLDPDIDIWQASKPIMEKAIRKEFSAPSIAEAVQEELKWQYLPLLHKIPDFLDYHLSKVNDSEVKAKSGTAMLLLGIVAGLILGLLLATNG